MPLAKLQPAEEEETGPAAAEGSDHSATTDEEDGGEDDDDDDDDDDDESDDDESDESDEDVEEGDLNDLDDESTEETMETTDSAAPVEGADKRPGDGDEADVESDDSADDNADKPSGLANVMAKILGKRVAENKPVILAKAKTDREIQWKKRQLKLEQEEEEGSEEKKTKTDDDDETKNDFEKNREKHLKRRQWEEMCHAKPHVLERDFERKFQRIATRGVVQLFNAVRKQQKTVEDKLKEAGSSVRRQDNVLKSVSKGNFLDMLKGSSTNDNANTDVPQTETADKAGSSWRVLRDDFMMGAKMKDWDQEESGSEMEEETL